MDSNFTQWMILGFCAFLFGLSKSGVKGIGVFIVTLMALAFGSKTSTGIVMPMLIVGDVFAILYYRSYVEWRYIFILLPSILLGILIGVYFGKAMPESLFKQIMASIIIISVILMYWWEYRKSIYVPKSRMFGWIMGGTAGFTTMIGNLAGAFSNIYFLVMRLPKNNFIGTAAYLYFIVNLFKLPFHIFYWKTISFSGLMLNVKVLPLQFLGLWVGVNLLKKIDDHYYRKMILFLTATGAILILFRS